MKRFAAEVGKQDFPVKWFKFSYPSPKPRMNENPVQKPVHATYSPIASMNYQWTTSLHDGYPPLQVLLPEEYILPSLHSFCNFKPTMFQPGDDYLCPTEILLPSDDNGERLLADVAIKVVEDIEKANGEGSKTSAIILALAMAKWRKSSPIVNRWTISKMQLIRKMRPMMTYTSSQH